MLSLKNHSTAIDLLFCVSPTTSSGILLTYRFLRDLPNLQMKPVSMRHPGIGFRMINALLLINVHQLLKIPSLPGSFKNKNLGSLKEKGANHGIYR